MRLRIIAFLIIIFCLSQGLSLAADLSQVVTDMGKAFYSKRIEAQIREEFNLNKDVKVLIDPSIAFVIIDYDIHLKDSIPEDLRVISNEKMNKLLVGKQPAGVIMASEGARHKVGDNFYMLDISRSGDIHLKCFINEQESLVGALSLGNEALILTKDGHILRIKRIKI